MLWALRLLSLSHVLGMWLIEKAFDVSFIWDIGVVGGCRRRAILLWIKQGLDGHG